MFRQRVATVASMGVPLPHPPPNNWEAFMSYFDLPPILEKMLSVAENISDLNFSVGRPPQVEINGKLTPVDIKGLRTLTPFQTEVIAMARSEECRVGKECRSR